MPDRRDHEPSGSIAVVKLYVALGLLVFVLAFVLQNTAPVTLRFLFWERTVSHIVVLLITALTVFFGRPAPGHVRRPKA